MRFVALTIAALVLAAWGGAVQAWPKGHAKIGAEQHPRILRKFGGEIENAALRAYVTRIGQAIAAVTPQAGEQWTFTVLDTPVVNAFALPGGYVYVTRGLVALANDEAEIAGVLGHEIAHVTRNHIDARQERGQKAGIGVLAGAVIGGLLDGKEGLRKGVQLGSQMAKGYVAQFSQKQEFEADNWGQRYMTAAGYDPLGQAEFLASMGAKHSLEARLAGKQYNPNRVDFFASHPATGNRVTRARKTALDTELRQYLRVGEADYMRAIDGMIYGDSARQGFVRGRSFSHPLMRFSYTVPEGFTITNSASAVTAIGPDGTRHTLNAAGKAKGSPAAYIRNTWVPGLARKNKVGPLGRIHEFSGNGVRGAMAELPVQRKGKPWIAHLTLIEHDGRFFPLTGLAPANDRRTLAAMAKTGRGFRALSARDAARLTPYRIDTVQVRRGDSIGRLTRDMPYRDARSERFLTLNGLQRPEDLRAGDIVKLIRP